MRIEWTDLDNQKATVTTRLGTARIFNRSPLLLRDESSGWVFVKSKTWVGLWIAIRLSLSHWRATRARDRALDWNQIPEAKLLTPSSSSLGTLSSNLTT